MRLLCSSYTSSYALPYAPPMLQAAGFAVCSSGPLPSYASRVPLVCLSLCLLPSYAPPLLPPLPPMLLLCLSNELHLKCGVRRSSLLCVSYASRMCSLCFSYASPMLFLCLSYALPMFLLCRPYALRLLLLSSLAPLRPGCRLYLLAATSFPWPRTAQAHLLAGCGRMPPPLLLPLRLRPLPATAAGATRLHRRAPTRRIRRCHRRARATPRRRAATFPKVRGPALTSSSAEKRGDERGA